MVSAASLYPKLSWKNSHGCPSTFRKNHVSGTQANFLFNLNLICFGNLSHKLGSHQKVLNLYLPRFHDSTVHPFNLNLLSNTFGLPRLTRRFFSSMPMQFWHGHAAFEGYTVGTRWDGCSFIPEYPQKISPKRSVFGGFFGGPKFRPDWRIQIYIIEIYWNVISSWGVCLSTIGQVIMSTFKSLHPQAATGPL